MSSFQGHQSPNAIAPPTTALVKMNCPERRPPLCSARSITSRGARDSVFESHSNGSEAFAAARAVSATSPGNEDETQAKRLSQLHPRAGHPSRREASAPEQGLVHR